jgi:hypothetical protein
MGWQLRWRTQPGPLLLLSDRTTFASFINDRFGFRIANANVAIGRRQNYSNLSNNNRV